jgi:hypothetical protein
MAKPYDTRLICVVAQGKFEVDFHQFCKLVPVMYVDGTRCRPEDFPNDGEIWWMLTAQTIQHAQPGKLVSCLVEDATEYDEHDPTKSRFQAKLKWVRDLELGEDGLEVLDIPANAMDCLRDLVSGGYQMKLDHQPTATVFLRWRSKVYGPFAPVATGSDTMAVWASFSPASKDMSVYHIDDEAFRMATEGIRHLLSNDVSSSYHRRSECFDLVSVQHELLLGRGFEQVLALNPARLFLEPIERTLLRFAKQCLTRKKRQELRKLLDELEVTGAEGEKAEDLADAIRRIKCVTERQDASLETVSKALLESGILGEERLRRAEQEYTEKYVQERTVELQAKIDSAIAAKRDEARQFESRLNELRAKLKKEEDDGRAKLRISLEAEAKKAREEIQQERARLDRDRAELRRQEAALKGNLQKVTQELRESGDEVVNRFLAIAPLLGSSILAASTKPAAEAEQPANQMPEQSETAWTLPAYITSTAPPSDDGVTEEAFLDRFRRVVEANGFVYRPFDLQRFHVSIKCGDLTVLGGPSGTGKSSLPNLYGQALLGDGDGDGDGREFCLMVNVNPSWMDIRDLLGHMNTLEGRYYPAESGLFQHLVCAQEEYAARSTSTALYLACLDEMNLSQVEYYFSDFMMVLERRGHQRLIQCFPAETIASHCPFRPWSRVTLAPSLRFVGTVNFDETTRLLSDRLLDRVNLIRLASGALPPTVSGETSGLARAQGRMVTLADFQTWQRDAALPADLASLLDVLRPLLAAMGCPLSPRVYRGMCRYVSSSEEIMSAGTAFDAQLAQRVIPKIRNLVTRSQLDALDDMVRTLEDSPIATFDASTMLLEEIREASQSRGWDIGE